MNSFRSTPSRILMAALFFALLPTLGTRFAKGSSSAPAKSVFAGSENLQTLTGETIAQAVDHFGSTGLTADKIAMTLIDLNDRDHPVWANHRGDEPIYPASVVKLFYLVAAHHQMESGALKESPEMDRALHDMIVDSSNDATHFVVDMLTGTTDGPELDAVALRDFMEKRNVVNTYFTRLGYNPINVNQKTWCEGPYGREKQGLGPNLENRNKLTTNAVARLIFEIVTGRAVSPARSGAMMGLMHRDPFLKSSDPDGQATAFSGKSLPSGSQYYSKAGWTSQTRHDAAYIRLPNGTEYILVVFTVDNSGQTDIIPFVSKHVAEGISRIPPAADLILLNGRLWSGNASQPWAEALASRGDRITAVGSNEDIKKLAGPKTQVIDLQGRLSLPGFIDDHTHFMSGGFQLLSVDLRDARTPKEFARRIREKAEKLGAGRWITGGDWDHELWPGAPLPTKVLIDPFTANNPVFVGRLDAHMALANSVALHMAKITKETQDPPGGTIVRDPKSGEPTGILKDAAMGLIWPLIPEPTVAEKEEAFTAALAAAARDGVTSIQDITPWSDFELYQRYHNAGRLTVRISARTPLSQWKQQADIVARQGTGDAWLRLGGLKAFMDGSLGSTTALFFDPYLDAPTMTGLMADDNIPEGRLKQNIRDADKAGLQCSVHAIGDKANHLLLNYFEEVEKENGPRDRRFRIEHAQHLLPSDVPRFARLGVIPSMQPYHAIDDGRWAERRLGPARLKTSYAFRALLDAGAALTFGSDWNVAPLSPLMGIYAAVTRETLDGKNPQGWIPQQKVTVEEAVRAYTIAAAYAGFEEHEKGSLEAGKLADVVVLSQDIFRIPPHDISKTEVMNTIIGGKVVHTR
ncbi:MAG: amidohydrolase family protein [Terriglobia bacterium]